MTLDACKRISPNVSNFVANQRFYWIRKIKHYIGFENEFKKDWIKTVKQCNVQILLELAISTEKFAQEK